MDARTGPSARPAAPPRGRRLAWSGLAAALVALALLAAASGCRAIAIEVPEDERLAAYADDPYRAVLAGSVRDGLVDYAALRRDHAGDLERYLDALGRFGPTSTPAAFPTEADRLAYYLNAYNALMLRRWLASDAGAREGLDGREVNKLWFVWNRWRVDGAWTTLHALEQDRIRPDFGEPRIHFALVCGALGCPPLLEEPFAGARLDEQLEALGRRWLAEPDGVVLADDGTLRMSSIFDWYREDFDAVGGLTGVLERFLAGDPRLPELLAAAADGIEFLPYDWTINDAAHAPPGP